jgi:hypothetical protein
MLSLVVFGVLVWTSAGAIDHLLGNRPSAMAISPQTAQSQSTFLEKQAF